MKFIPSNLALGSLVLAIASTVYGQDSSTAKPDAATNSTNAAPSTTESGLRFEGTDLHIGSLPPISFHGFASQGFLATSEYNYLGGRTKDGSFRFNEFGLNASMSPFPHLRLAAQGFAFTAGNVGNDTPVLDYGLADYNFCDEIGIRAGRIRRPAGIYNDIQDLDLARTSVILPQGIYDARWRDFTASVDGGSVYGNIPLSKVGSMSYEVYGGHVELSQEGGISRMLQDFQGSNYRGVDGFTTVGGQTWWHTPIEGLRAGVASWYIDGFGFNSSMFGMPLRGEANHFATQYSLEYLYKSWTFQAELRESIQTSHTFLNRNEIASNRSRPESWYVGAAYRFNKWVELGSYYTEYYEDANNRGGDGSLVPSDAWQKDVALSLRFDPKPWWIVKVEGHFLNGTALLDNNGLNRVRDDNDWLMLAVKTTFSF